MATAAARFEHVEGAKPTSTDQGADHDALAPYRVGFRVKEMEQDNSRNGLHTIVFESNGQVVPNSGPEAERWSTEHGSESEISEKNRSAGKSGYQDKTTKHAPIGERRHGRVRSGAMDNSDPITERGRGWDAASEVDDQSRPILGKNGKVGPKEELIKSGFKDNSGPITERGLGWDAASEVDDQGRPILGKNGKVGPDEELIKPGLKDNSDPITERGLGWDAASEVDDEGKPIILPTPGGKPDLRAVDRTPESTRDERFSPRRPANSDADVYRDITREPGSRTAGD